MSASRTSIRPERSSAVIPLFPPERVTRHLLTTGYGTPAQAQHTVTTVTGADGITRVVERSRTLTGAHAEEAVRFGAASVWPR